MAELELIQRIRRRIGPAGTGTIVGVGDDAAVYEPPGKLELITCDAFVEDIHFRREFATFREIGAKCMVANLSDIAAMGGFPTKAVISICVPRGVDEGDVEALYEGALAVCGDYGAEIVGGDVVGSTSGLVVSIALVGAVDRDRVVTRSGAVPGDALIVTGTLGGSEAGLRALIAELPREGPVAEATRRHLVPAARVAEAQAILDVATPHAMIDISDGLSSDLWHIAEESGVGVRVDAAQVPLASCATEVAARLGVDPIELALVSGEEFELLVAIPASESERTVEHVEAVTGTGVSVIGVVVPSSEGCTLSGIDGTTGPLPRAGYEHLTE